jgi:hypothetical protein
LLVISVLLWGGSARGDVVAAWHFDEAGGSTAFAAAGSVDGALMGDAQFVSGGISGGAVSMTSASSGLVDMGNNFAFDGNSTFSIVAWLLINDGDTNGYLAVGRHQASVIAGYFLGINNTGSGSGEVTGGGIYYQSYPNPVSQDLGLKDGTWHQLVGVHDFAANEARLYVDGMLRDTQAYDSFGISAANFAVGGILNAAGTQMVGSLNGTVDEVSLWNRALTDSDVAYLYNNPGALVIPEPATLGLFNILSLVAIASRRRRASH